MKIPLLFFSRAEETLESWSATHQDKDQFCVAPNVLNEWGHGDLYSFRMMAMSHIQFSSIFQRSERFRKEGLRFVPADYSLEEGAETLQLGGPIYAGVPEPIPEARGGGCGVPKTHAR
jgi:hypothetical protein